MRTDLKTLAFLLTAICTQAAATPTPTATIPFGDDASETTFDEVLYQAYRGRYAAGSGPTTLAKLPGTTAPRPVATTPGRQAVNAVTGLHYFVDEHFDGELIVVDGHTGQTVASVGVGRNPVAVTADFRRGEVYVVNHGSNDLSIVDADSFSILATVPTGAAPTAVSVDPRRGVVYSVNQGDDTLTAIDAVKRQAIATIPVGRNPAYPTVDERSGKVYVNAVDDRAVSVVAGTPPAVVKQIRVGGGTTFGSISPIYRRYYLPNSLDATVSVIDTESDKVLRTIVVGLAPHRVVVDPNGGNLYVLSRDNDSVTVIDALTEQVVATLAASRRPTQTETPAGPPTSTTEQGGPAATLSAAPIGPKLVDTAIVTEFIDLDSNRYFHSANAVETRLIGDGLLGDKWVRTMQFWRVWTTPEAGRVPMCRFFGPQFAPSGTHFYTPLERECQSMRTAEGWTYEGDVYYVALPDSQGACPSGTTPLHRYYNSDADGGPSHRVVANQEVRRTMRGSGWTAEGSGDAGSFACVPTLRGE